MDERMEVGLRRSTASTSKTRRLTSFHTMLSRIKQRLKGNQGPIDENGVNYTQEHVRLAKTIARRRRVINAFWARLHLVR